jgi:hypothetical protein
VDADWKDLDLAQLLEHGRDQTPDLTFYKLVFQALEQIAWRNAPTPEVYRTSFLALAAGFLASVKPELLPQAVAAKNLLLKNHPF